MTTEGSSAPLVVVGVDGSAESVGALKWASCYAAATGATTTAVLCLALSGRGGARSGRQGAQADLR